MFRVNRQIYKIINRFFKLIDVWVIDFFTIRFSRIGILNYRFSIIIFRVRGNAGRKMVKSGGGDIIK
jgi:hypothetical protein